MLTVSALLREIVFALTAPAACSTRAREHLLHVAITELVDATEQPLHLRKARDDRLRTAVERLEPDRSARSRRYAAGRAEQFHRGFQRDTSADSRPLPDGAA